MHQPERWPLSQAEDWWAWRDHLAHIQDPNIATLKRVRDCEDLAVLRGQVGAPLGVTPAKRLPPSVAGRAGWRAGGPVSQWRYSLTSRCRAACRSA